MKSLHHISMLGISILAALCLLAACGGQAAADAQGTVGVLLSADEVDPQDELNGTFTTWRGTWDLEAGTLETEASPAFETVGQNRHLNLLAWNGTDQYIVWDDTCVSDKSGSMDVILWGAADGGMTIWGPGYQVEIMPERQWTVTRSGEDPVVFQGAEESGLMDLDDMSLLGSGLKGDQLVLVYAAFGGQDAEENTLLCLTLDLAAKEILCSNQIEIPSEYCDGMFLASVLYYPILDGKLYFSSWDSVAYFDLETHRFTALDNIPAQIEKVIPNLDRTGFDGIPDSVDLVGSTENTVIASVCYEEKDTQVSHVVYAAVQGDRMVGLLDQRQEEGASTMTVYDEDLQQTDQAALPSVNTAPQFQMMVSPLPF